MNKLQALRKGQSTWQIAFSFRRPASNTETLSQLKSTAKS